MVVVGNNAREDSQDGELGLDDQQLGNPAGAKGQQDGAGNEEEPQGNSDEEAPEGDGVQDDQHVKEEVAEEQEAAQESSGFAGQGPSSTDLKERVRQLEKQLADPVAGKMKPSSSFQGVKLRPADPPKYAGGNKDVVKDWLATMVRCLGSRSCVPEQRVPLAQTFLTGSAASLWRAKSAALQAQGFDIQDWDVFARTLEQAFGHQDPEQNARDKLDVLKQAGSVEDYANKFQSLVAEIVAMPPSEGDLLQKFRNGLKPDIQMAACIDPVTGTRWMNLQKFISFACATDASRAQATKGKHASDKSEQGKSSSSGASYKDKLKGKRPNESSHG
jgi:hypothetical protein